MVRGNGARRRPSAISLQQWVTISRFHFLDLQRSLMRTDALYFPHIEIPNTN